jgi:hypothetical protein
VVVGYIVMPKHIHLLIREPRVGSSHRFYRLEEDGPVRVNEGWTEISLGIGRAEASLPQAFPYPLFAECAKDGAHSPGDASEIKSLVHPPWISVIAVTAQKCQNGINIDHSQLSPG